MKVGRDLKRPSPHAQYGSEGYFVEVDSNAYGPEVNSLPEQDLYLYLVYLCLKKIAGAALLDKVISKDEYLDILSPYKKQKEFEDGLSK